MAAGPPNAVAPQSPRSPKPTGRRSVGLDRRPWAGTVYRAVGLTRAKAVVQGRSNDQFSVQGSEDIRHCDQPAVRLASQGVIACPIPAESCTTASIVSTPSAAPAALKDGR
jgi:hypothetical protein